MKLYNNFKSLIANCALLFAVLGLTACASDEYTPADQLTSAQVYFANTLPQKQELDKDASSFTFNLNRVNTSGALEVALSVTGNEESKFNIPQTVTFADGAATAPITIGYDGEDFDYDDFTDLELKIAENGYTTPYGNSFYAFQAGVPAPWEYIGDGTYKETSGSWWEEKLAVTAKMYRNMIDPTKYRMEYPLAQYLTDEEYYNERGEDIKFTVLPAGSQLGNITTTQNGLVYFEPWNWGYDYGDGYGDIYCYHPADYTEYADDEENFTGNYVSQWSEDGTTPEIITFSPIYQLSDYDYYWDYSQDKCARICMPGIVEADYSLDVTYEGRFSDTDKKDYAVAYFTLGTDVSSVKAALIAGEDEDAAVEALLDGSAEAAELSKSGEMQFVYPETGKYVLVAAAYNGDGVAKTVQTQVLTLRKGESWTAVGTGTYTFNAFFEESTATDLVLYQSITDPDRYKIGDWCESGDPDYGLVFNWDKTTNRITFDEPSYTGYSDENGKVYMSNMIYYGQETDDEYPSTYDPDTKTFNFIAVYWYNQYPDDAYYNEDMDPETFVLDTSSSARAKAKKLAARKTTRKTTHKVTSNHPKRRPMLKKN